MWIHDPAARALWSRWIGANALAECVGLGAVALLATALGPRLAASPRASLQLAFAAALVAGGVLEGVIVGAAQARVLRTAWPALGAGRWTRATALGALLAWILGMLPSTVMALLGGPDAAASPARGERPTPEPSAWIVYPGAAALGAVAGVVLSSVQWRELRRHVPRAARWLPANALAWALGMPVIFALVDRAASVGYPWALPLAAVGLALAGAVVGAVHGAALVAWLVPRPLAGPTRGTESGTA